MNDVEEIKPFWREIVDHLLWVLVGSVLAGALALAGLFGIPIPKWIAWLSLAGGAIMALLRAAKSQYDQRVLLMQKLEQCGITVEQKRKARSQLAVLSDAEKVFVRQLLGCRLRFSQICSWYPDVDVLRIDRETSFLKCGEVESRLHAAAASGFAITAIDSEWSIDPSWHVVLIELLVKPPPSPSFFARLWRRILCVWREIVGRRKRQTRHK